MFTMTNLYRTGIRTMNTNAPAILTAFGAVGAVTATVLSAKAAFEAAEKIASHESAANAKREAGDERVHLSKTEKAKLVWPLFLPAGTTCVVSVGAIVMAHRVSSRRAAALAAAYALSEGRLEEYQDKVKEKFGLKKSEETRDSLHQDRVNRDYDEGTVIFDPMEGKVLIRDDYSGRFFWSSIQEVERAVNTINREVNMNFSGGQTISDFYDELGLDHISTSDHFGWDQDNVLEISWSTTTTPDGTKAVHSFEFVNSPKMNPGGGASFR